MTPPVFGNREDCQREGGGGKGDRQQVSVVLAIRRMVVRGFDRKLEIEAAVFIAPPTLCIQLQMELYPKNSKSPRLTSALPQLSSAGTHISQIMIFWPLEHVRRSTLLAGTDLIAR